MEWDREVERFFGALQRFDAYLASDAPLAVGHERLFQGAIADSLTHIGQLAMMRRLSGAKMKSENYAKADIAAGRVGSGANPSAARIRLKRKRRIRRERDHTEQQRNRDERSPRPHVVTRSRVSGILCVGLA